MCPELFHLYPISMHKLGHVYIAMCLGMIKFFLPSWSKRASNQKVIQGPGLPKSTFLEVKTS